MGTVEMLDGAAGAQWTEEAVAIGRDELALVPRMVAGVTVVVAGRVAEVGGGVGVGRHGEGGEEMEDGEDEEMRRVARRKVRVRSATKSSARYKV